MFSTSTAVTIVEGFVDDLVSVIFGILPEVLLAVAVLMAISIGIRYAYRWIRKAAR